MALKTKNLWAKAGLLSFPGKTIPFWGFSSSARGTPKLPGPIIEATVGDKIRIRLRNDIGEPVSIIFPGQDGIRAKFSDEWTFRPVQPRYSGGIIISLTDYLDAGTTKYIEYAFRVTKPGIYLYESGTNPEKQIQMGLYGIILVRPFGYNLPFHPNYMTAYGAGTGSNYDVEKVLVLGEIDSVMHNDVIPAVYYDMLKYKPDCWLINGRSFPDTLGSDNNSSQPSGSGISCRVGQRVLLRVINAGYQNHTFYLGGLMGRVVAGDSFPLMTPEVDATYEKTGVTLGSGQSFDIVFTPAASGEFYLYDREYNHLVNNEQFPGGMMTRMQVSP
ncbi:MAG: multicopper oxidase domain-containing protein [Bacillota bacterium]